MNETENNLILDNVDFQTYYNYMISTTIERQLLILANISQKESNTNTINDVKKDMIIDIKAYLNWRGKYVVLLPIYNYTGGQFTNSEFIWPIFTNIFNKNTNNLKFTGKDDTKIIINVRDNIDSFEPTTRPLLGKGNFTAVYEVTMDSNEYILRLTKYKDIHYLYYKKCINNYDIYRENLMEICLHGIIESRYESGLIVEDDFDLSITKPITDFCVDYILTKKYNRFIKESLLTNRNKYDILMNLLLLLEKMRINGEFHADLKISNIGWDDSMNIILIDYDENTIMSIDDGEKLFRLEPDKPYFTRLISSHRNQYLNYIDHTRIDSIRMYDKYSMYGLWHCILQLHILVRPGKFFLDQIPNFQISKLNNVNYTLIPNYMDLINNLQALESAIV